MKRPCSASLTIRCTAFATGFPPYDHFQTKRPAALASRLFPHFPTPVFRPLTIGHILKWVSSALSSSKSSKNFVRGEPFCSRDTHSPNWRSGTKARILSTRRITLLPPGVSSFSFSHVTSSAPSGSPLYRRETCFRVFDMIPNLIATGWACQVKLTVAGEGLKGENMTSGSKGRGASVNHPPRTETSRLAEGGMLTVPQAADRLGLRPSTMRAWIAARRIAFVRLGRAIRIPAREVERLLTDGYVPAR